MGHFFPQNGQKLLQLAVMRRRDVSHHEGQKLQNFLIFYQFSPPRNPVHIGKVNLHLFAESRKIIAVLIVQIVFIGICNIGEVNFRSCRCFKIIDRVNRSINQFLYTAQGQIEGIDRAFHSLHQIDCHQAANTHFTANLIKSNLALLITIERRIFLHTARQYVMRWPVDIQIQLCQLFEDFVVTDGIFQIRQVRTV